MDKKKIKENIGNIVGYKRASDMETRPVLLLDGRLWIRYTNPQVHVQAIATSLAPTGDAQIGYPVLAIYGEYGENKRHMEGLVAWMRTSTLRMDDLFDGQGDEIKGLLPEGIIFKVVSGRHLVHDYERAAAEDEALTLRAAADRDYWLNEEAMKVERAHSCNDILAEMGVENADGSSPVKLLPMDTQLVGVHPELLLRLIRTAQRAAMKCDSCSVDMAPKVVHHEDGRKSLVCGRCHVDASRMR